MRTSSARPRQFLNCRGALLSFLLGIPSFVYSDGTRVGFDFDEHVPFGSDLRWSATITNDSASAKTYRISFFVSSLQHNGRRLGEVESPERGFRP